MRFGPELQQRMRRTLLDRGRVLSLLLADVLAGKPAALARVAALDAKPGERPHEKLKRVLAQVEGRRKLLDAGDDAFGRCDECGVDLGEVNLLEMPWADRCSAHMR